MFILQLETTTKKALQTTPEPKTDNLTADQQTDRHTDQRAERQTNQMKDRHTEKLTDGTQTAAETGRAIEIEIERERGRGAQGQSSDDGALREAQRKKTKSNPSTREGGGQGLAGKGSG